MEEVIKFVNVSAVIFLLDSIRIMYYVLYGNTLGKCEDSIRKNFILNKYIALLCIGWIISRFI